MIILDTSFLAAYFRSSDVHHAKAVHLAKKYRDEKMVISFLVFQELISHLNRKASTETSNSIAKSLLSEESNIEIYKLDEAMMEGVLDLFQKLAPHSFSYIDVSLIHLSKELGLPVLTFDRLLEEKLGVV